MLKPKITSLTLGAVFGFVVLKLLGSSLRTCKHKSTASDSLEDYGYIIDDIGAWLYTFISACDYEIRTHVSPTCGSIDIIPYNDRCKCVQIVIWLDMKPTQTAEYIVSVNSTNEDLGRFHAPMDKTSKYIIHELAQRN